MKRTTILALVTGALAVAPAAFCQVTDTGTSALGVTVGPEASLTAVTANTSLTGDTKFGARTGTTNYTYKIRTTQSTGTGSITVEVTTFGAGGPAVSDLSYTCAGAASGSPCSSSTGASTSAGTNVATFGPDAHSQDSGDSGSVSWNLVDRTAIKTGTYTSTATFTISAS